MSACTITLFPQKQKYDCKTGEKVLSTRSGVIRVKCGEYVKLKAYGLCPGMCIKISEVYEDKCKCEYFECPYCVAGGQIGVDADCPSAAIPMPGCYVAYLCVEEDVELPEEWKVVAEVCDHVENLQVVMTAACCAMECN